MSDTPTTVPPAHAWVAADGTAYGVRFFGGIAQIVVKRGDDGWRPVGSFVTKGDGAAFLIWLDELAAKGSNLAAEL